MPSWSRTMVLALACSSSALLGCGVPESVELENYLDPVATESSLVWANETTHELVFGRPQSGRWSVARRAIGDERTRIAWMTPSVAGDELLALVVPESQKQEDVGETLYVFDAQGRDEPRTFEVFAPFSTVSLSPDGRLAVLHFGGGPGEGILENANQVAIVDLFDGIVRTFTLNGFGGRLQSVQFPTHDDPRLPPRIAIGDTERELLAFLADGEVVFVDVERPTDEQVAIRFLPTIDFVPQEVLLRRADDRFNDPVIFLRSASSPDIAMLPLVPKADGRFTAQVSLVPVGNGASDFATYDADDVPYLVTLDPQRQLIVFTDIRTQQGFSVALDTPDDRLFMRDHDDGQALTRQLVTFGNRQLIHTLDLEGIDDELGRRPERLNIPTSIGELVQLDNDRSLVGSDGTLYVVDFARGQVTPLSSSIRFDPASARIEANTLILGAEMTETVSVVDLLTLDPESMVLDEPIASFHVLDALDKIAVVHPDRLGHVTVVDALEPSRSTSYSSWGFLYADAFDLGDER